ncbi:MAG: FAD-dependent oxidoreductase [Luteimonas sp.]
MGRTPLFDMLQRSARIANASLHDAEPLDAFYEHGKTLQREARRTDPSRRRFLQAAGAGLVLAGCASVPKPLAPAGDDVVVVGAGIAGLTAAWRLRQAGVRVRVFEAQNRIGGRMFSLRNHFPDGQVIELGGELIDSNHVRIRALAAELGLPLDDLLAGDTAQDTWFFDGRNIGEREIVTAFAPVAAAIQRDLALLGDEALTYRAASPQTHAQAQALDALSVAQWLDRNGVSGWLRKLIDVAYTTEMGLEIDQQSALNLLTFIGSEDKDAFKVFGESDERSHVRGGNDLIVHELARKLGDALETGSVLEAVDGDAGGYALSFRRDRATRTVRARHVVLALPFTLLRKVRIGVALPEVKRRALDGLAYGTNAKLMIGYDKRVWREHAANGASMSDLPYQTTWETTRKQPGNGGVLTNFTGGRHGVALGEGTPKEQADAATASLDKVFPGLAAARAGMREARFHWPTHPWTLGSYACFGPGDWTGFRGAIGESVGGLHFAGEHCALDTQGFMEGGCESGETAAAAVRTAFGIASVRPIGLRKRAA